MLNIKKIAIPEILRFCCYALFFSALAFSIFRDGSYAFWRKTVLQTMIFFSFFFYVTERRILQKRPIDTSLVDTSIIVIFSFSIIVSIFALNTAVAFSSMLQLLSCLCAFYISVSIGKKREVQIWLIHFMGFITLVLCTYGLLIHFKIYLVHDWRYINFAQGGSLSANFANHNHLAGWLEMMIFLWTGLLFARKRSLIKTVVIVFILLVMIASIIFSLSRGGWIATLTGAGFILLATRFHNTFLVPKKILSITIVLFFCLVLGILGSGSVVKRGMTVVEQQSDVIPARTIAWTGAVEMIKTYPLTGVGIGNFPIIFTQFQPPGLNFRFYELHNDYLQFTAEMGLFFIPLLLWLIFNLFKTGFKKLDHPSRQTRWITLGAMGGVVAILVHSVSDFNLQFPSNALLFTLLAAQVAAPAPALKRR